MSEVIAVTCSCGCGAQVKPGRRFIQGHHLLHPTEETKQRRQKTRRSNAELGRELRAARLQRMREAYIG